MWHNLLLAAAVASSSAQQQQFDLICPVTMHTIRVSLGPQSPDQVMTEHYRIDLKAGKWCESACTVINPIADVQPGLIQLRPDDNDHGIMGGPGRYTSYIDRTTGEEHILSEDNDSLLGDSTTTWEGKCEPAPFSGFPNVQTKF